MIPTPTFRVQNIPSKGVLFLAMDGSPRFGFSMNGQSINKIASDWINNNSPAPAYKPQLDMNMIESARVEFDLKHRESKKLTRKAGETLRVVDRVLVEDLKELGLSDELIAVMHAKTAADLEKKYLEKPDVAEDEILITPKIDIYERLHSMYRYDNVGMALLKKKSSSGKSMSQVIMEESGSHEQMKEWMERYG